MSLGYFTIAWATSVKKGVIENVDYGYKGKSTAGNVFGFFNGLGDVAFAYAGHNVVLEIQATIPSTPERPSKCPMWRGVVVAYIVVALCYFPVAFISYRMFGNKVDDNILITLERPKWLIAKANMFVVIHVIGSYQIYAMPVFDMIETLLVKKLKFRPVFLGGFAFAPTTYFLPCIMWLTIYKPKRFSLSWWTNWICIVVGVCLMILSPIGGLRTIIVEAKTYKFYS
ncbi:hypothetical protein QN277_013456 [Acacia crassicarpa]|uniref:Amino acid transporter transmembrane domain-containing protein n=1 Tax=Acacia crassicarpa TaxID=499986 RepID=A0AAE1N3M3_9FABA|nr:hypothetical protein QN277_013456 [Acacia crassicarpa]